MWHRAALAQERQIHGPAFGVEFLGTDRAKMFEEVPVMRPHRAVRGNHLIVKRPGGILPEGLGEGGSDGRTGGASGGGHVMKRRYA